jgi:predicted transcriptional regulator
MEASPAGFPFTIPALLSSPVGIVMNSDIILLESDDYARRAAELMKERNQNSVLVSNNGEVVGIVSETDILDKVARAKDMDKVRLREIMSSPVIAVAPSTTVKEALEVMKARHVKQVMVHAYSAAIGVVSIKEVYEMMGKVSRISII